MLIAILICLLSDTTAVEQFRFERLQGQCSAWCYETYGTWAETDQIFGTDTVEVYQCLSNQTCHDCDIGCSYEFHNLRECYSRCNEREACKAACKYHQKQSRDTVDVDVLEKNLSRVYPHDVYEDSGERNHTTIVLQWSHTKQFSEKRAVVFMLFLLNYTSNDPNENPQGLYIGSTPHYSFVVQPLSQNYCYRIRVLTVSKDGVVGKGVSSNKFLTDAIIKAENITATSADIWFQTRPCAGHVTYTVQLVYDVKDKDNNYLELDSPSDMENSIYRIRAPNLIPNQVYRVVVGREKTVGDLFSYHGEFKTLGEAPDTDVTISLIAGISATNITYIFGVTDGATLYETVSYYMMNIVSEDGLPIKELKIESREEREVLTVLTELTPYTVYCVSIAVANPYGLGPFSKQHCTRTLSAPAGPPSLRPMSVATNGAVIHVTRPDPPKGELVQYYVTFIHHTLVELNVTLTHGAEQNVTLESLESHTRYIVSVAAVNSKGQIGVAATLPITTPQSRPESAPEVSTCDMFTNSTHISAKVSWISVDEDDVNGELLSYSLNLLQQNFVDGDGQVVNNQTYTFTLENTTQEVFEVIYEDVILDYSKHETVSARLALSTTLGMGPWSKHFECTIDHISAKMGVDAVQIIVIVISIIALFIVILGAFFYFFRFKTYKKTPYEEIKKLIRPDTFSPCQHCMHNKDPKRWDVFICHVSEDTEYIVQLKEAFVREKIEVFFAKDELSWGCELHRVINDGLRDSKYGLVVLSKQFVSKCSKWTSSELSSLHSKSRLSSQDCILPIWKKDITEVDVGAFDMTLVGIKALKEEGMTVDQMAVELKKKLRSSNTCWGCKSYEYQWSASDYSLDNSPVDSLHTTLL